MVLQVLAHTGQIAHARDPEAAEMAPIPDPGALQQRRGGNRSGRKNDVARGDRLKGLAAARPRDANGATLLEPYPGHHAPGFPHANSGVS